MENTILHRENYGYGKRKRKVKTILEYCDKENKY